MNLPDLRENRQLIGLYWNQTADIRINGHTSEEVEYSQKISLKSEEVDERCPTRLCSLLS